MTPNVGSPDRRGKQGQPWSHPARQRGFPLGILLADGRLKSLVVYLTTTHLKEFKDDQRTNYL